MNLESDGMLQGLYVSYKEELIRYAITRAGLPKNEAEDVVQSAFLRLSKSGVDSIDNHRAYLYKTTFNLAVDLRRRANVRGEHASESDIDESAYLDELDPETVAGDQESLRIILQSLRIMPARRRQLLILHRFDGLSYAEIARRVDLSETVVRKHISKALADCQKMLKRGPD